MKPRMAEPIRSWLRRMLALLYALAGIAHLDQPHSFLSITPDWVPQAERVVFWTGFAEIAGAAALAQSFSPRLRRFAGAGLAAYAICVFPANLQHFAMDMERSDGGLGLAYHVPRMALQPLLVWLALWTAEVIDWPMRACCPPP